MKITKHTAGEAIFPYIAYIPENCSEHPAMILQLHGIGERGNGGDDLDLVLVNGFAKIVNDANLTDCILIMPQCPADSFWLARIESIKAFIDQMMEKYAVDPDRLYMAGISMGAFGTWYSAVAYPKLFAAIAPCCGGCLAPHASELTMPIWAFHGLEDTAVPPVHTVDMINVLQDSNPHFRYTLYEGVGHNCWDLAFSEKLLSWLLKQHR